MGQMHTWGLLNFFPPRDDISLTCKTLCFVLFLSFINRRLSTFFLKWFCFCWFLDILSDQLLISVRSSLAWYYWEAYHIYLLSRRGEAKSLISFMKLPLHPDWWSRERKKLMNKVYRWWATLLINFIYATLCLVNYILWSVGISYAFERFYHDII